MSAVKKAAKDIKSAIAKRDFIKAHTFYIYSIHQPRSKDWKWTPPFMAPNDESARNALVEMSKTNPEICRKNVYCIASWCSIDGKLVKFNNPRCLCGNFEKVKEYHEK